MDKQQITIVFASGGTGIWKAQTVFSGMESCKCRVEVSPSITGKMLSSTKLSINYGNGSNGNYSFLKENECTEDYKLTMSLCDGMKDAMLKDYTNKNTVGPLLIKDRDTIWIDGYEFSKE